MQKFTIVINVFKSVVLLILVLTLSNLSVTAQDSKDLDTERIDRANILNPAFVLEYPSSKSSVFSMGMGLGYGGSFPNLSTNVPSGFLYDFSPFLNLQHQWIYNRANRMEKGRTVAGNSGNFISARLFIRGPSLSSNFVRKSNIEFVVGPTWGLRRQWGENIHFSFEFGPVYYFDFRGNQGVFPLIPYIQLGININ
ncbi:MAG: hypothetical protein EA411_04075 [Saprospirales bacterium]|nr:MAG: hypothetical protein EA411_04075 [Saprospirales bacterium]